MEGVWHLGKTQDAFGQAKRKIGVPVKPPFTQPKTEGASEF